MKLEKGKEADMNEEVFDYIDSVEATSKYINSQAFEAILNQDKTGSFSLSEINRILEFISDQHGYWHAEWTFSEALDPNTEAQSESENWDILWRAFSKSLKEAAPETAEPMAHLHQMIKLKHTVKQRVAYNESRPLERFFTSVLSGLAIFLKKIGFSRIASHIYSASLFPKGTVGHG